MSHRRSIRQPAPFSCAASCATPTAALLPGIFVKIRLPMGKVVQSALLVPDRALQEDQGGRYLLVLSQDNVVQQRYVQLGELIGDLRVITSGLDAGRPRGDRRALARRSRHEGGAATDDPRRLRSTRR